MVLPPQVTRAAPVPGAESYRAVFALSVSIAQFVKPQTATSRNTANAL